MIINNNQVSEKSKKCDIKFVKLRKNGEKDKKVMKFQAAISILYVNFIPF